MGALTEIVLGLWNGRCHENKRPTALLVIPLQRFVQWLLQWLVARSLPENLGSGQTLTVN